MAEIIDLNVSARATTDVVDGAIAETDEDFGGEQKKEDQEKDPSSGRRPSYWDWRQSFRMKKEEQPNPNGNNYWNWRQSLRGAPACDDVESVGVSADTGAEEGKGEGPSDHVGAGYWNWRQSIRNITTNQTVEEKDQICRGRIASKSTGGTYWDWKQTFHNNKAPEEEDGKDAEPTERRQSGGSYWDWRQSFRNNKSTEEKVNDEGGEKQMQERKPSCGSYWNWKQSFRNNKPADGAANGVASVNRASWQASMRSIRSSVHSLGIKLEEDPTDNETEQKIMEKSEKVIEEKADDNDGGTK